MLLVNSFSTYLDSLFLEARIWVSGNVIGIPIVA